MSVQPVCYIMRGLPGSGKSTLAQEIAKTHEDSVIVSTDDRFMEDGVYKFDFSRREEAHKATREIAKNFFDAKKKCVIIDNTNLTIESLKPYVKMAFNQGYKIEFKESSTPWRYNVEECAKRNKHSVPKEVIQGMFDSFVRDVNLEKIVQS
jgi:predicted kinase